MTSAETRTARTLEELTDAIVRHTPGDRYAAHQIAVDVLPIVEAAEKRGRGQGQANAERRIYDYLERRGEAP